MMIPKKTKFKNNHLFSYEGKAKGNKEINFGSFGLQSCQGNYISNKAIEAGRKVISPYIKKEKGSKMWIRIFPHLGKTKKPIGSVMGSGKGNIEEWKAVVKNGTIIFEIEGVSEVTSRKILEIAGHKLPVKCKVVKKSKTL